MPRTDERHPLPWRVQAGAIATALALAVPCPALAAPDDEPEPSEAPETLDIIANPAVDPESYVEPVVPDAFLATLPPDQTTATVQVMITLLADGSIGATEVLHSDGEPFAQALIDAIRAWSWTPAQTAAGPIDATFTYAYTFELDRTVVLPVNLTGQVREMATRNELGEVSVSVRLESEDGGEPIELLTTTDAEGRFELRGVPSGLHAIRLVHGGHKVSTTEVLVVDGELVDVKLWMEKSGLTEELVVVGEREKEEVTRHTLSIEEIKRIPGTFGDPVKAIQTLPGAARTPFGTGLLVIRGANPEDSGVYIDGIRIPIIYHLTGTTSVISPELIDSVDYLPGGYGVQYGRTMGGTIDVKTKKDFGDDPKLVWGTDILDSQLFFEGKLGKKKKQGIAVGARRSYIDAFIPIFTGDTGYTIKPRYWDYQLKWAPQLEGGTQASVFWYGFDDKLTVATPEDVAQGSDQDTQGDLGIQYNSHRIVGRWRKEFTDSLALDLTPSLGIDTSNLGLGSDFTLKNGTWLGNVRGQLEWQATPAVEVVPGFDLYGGFWWFEFASAVNFESADDPLAEREPVGFDGRGNFWSPDPFVKVNLRPLDNRERWLVTPGVRLNTTLLSTGGGVAGDVERRNSVTQSVDPRILSRFEIVPERFAIKGATGLYHQPPQPQEAVGVGTAANVGYERSWSSSLGFQHRLNQALNYNVDVFYRSMDEQIVFDEAWTGYGSNPFVNEGLGRAYGTEVILRHDPANRFFGWISYTLSRSVRNDYPSSCEDPAGNDLLGIGECWIRFDFDQTHILSAQGGYDLPHDFGVSAQVQYVTGNPFSPYNAGVYDADSDFYNGFAVGKPNSERLPPYVQTSLRFDKLFTFKSWQLETYVDLLNVVRGVNPEFTLYNYDYSEYAYVRGLPFIPNIGIEAKFYP